MRYDTNRDPIKQDQSEALRKIEKRIKKSEFWRSAPNLSIIPVKTSTTGSADGTSLVLQWIRTQSYHGNQLDISFLIAFPASSMWFNAVAPWFAKLVMASAPPLAIAFKTLSGLAKKASKNFSKLPF